MTPNCLLFMIHIVKSHDTTATRAGKSAPHSPVLTLFYMNFVFTNILVMMIQQRSYSTSSSDSGNLIHFSTHTIILRQVDGISIRPHH